MSQSLTLREIFDLFRIRQIMEHSVFTCMLHYIFLWENYSYFDVIIKVNDHFRNVSLMYNTY